MGEVVLGDPGRADALLRVDGLSVWFDTARGRLHAVDGVSFEVARGQTLGIVGESGSGKSVTVRAIMGILPRNATVGADQKIVLDGRDVATLSRSQRKHFWGSELAMVFQDPMTSLNPVRRIGAQIIESMRFHLHIGRREARARAIDLLRLVGIPDPVRRLRQFPHELSGGMRQRVTIAIAVACRPKLLIADEPTTALDVTVQKQILDLLGELQSTLEMSTILITHDLGVVAGRAHRTAVMYAGEIVEIGPTLDLFESTRHPYTQALLRSIPRVDHRTHDDLYAIAGRPPDLVGAKVGCSFAPRCPYAQDRCRTDAPPMTTVGEHAWRCHFPAGTAHGDFEPAANTVALVKSEA